MQQSLKGKRIFIVEDDTTNMAVFAYLLKSQGALVIQDHWNSSTLQLLKNHHPIDIILLDLMLRRGVSGYQIFDTIKGNPEFATIPILAVTASDPNIEIPKLQEKGFNGYIGKPISIHTFPKQIADCLNGVEIWASVESI
jgi:CheY-like chemotaxis protein